MKARRGAEAATLAALVVYWFYFATRARWVWTAPDFLQPWMGDFSILMTSSIQIGVTGRYPALDGPGLPGFFPYAPPAVVMFIVFGWLGPSLGMTVFLLLKLAALAAVLWAALSMTGAARAPGRAAVAVIAVAAADPWISSDLRQNNMNVIYVALVAVGAVGVARSAGGTLLAVATAFKLYSGLFLPWLAITGRLRAAAIMVVALIGLFVVLPLVWFGPATTISLYRDWLAQIEASGTRAIHDSPGPWITLRRFLSLTMNADPFADAVAAGILVLQAAWIGVLAAYAWATRGVDRTAPFAIGADAGVLMLAPLPFSTVLQPTHGSPLLLVHGLLAAVALDRAQDRSTRMMCVGVIAATIALQWSLRPWAWRGGVFFAVICLAVLGLAVASRARALAR